jgi:hypothetical protein
MLTAQAPLLLLMQWSKDKLDPEVVPRALIYHDVPRTLLDILARTMRSQQVDGSWESKREVTAYTVLTLAHLLHLPWVEFLRPEGIACMFRGKAYLKNDRHQWRTAEHIWVEKTVYGSSNLSQVYCLAAVKVAMPPIVVSTKVSDMLSHQMTVNMTKMSAFFGDIPPFSSAPKWKMQLSLLQSASYTAALKDHRYDIFPAMEEASDEKYQEYIPFTWIGCKDYLATSISPSALWDMMLVSMFNFQVDAFMETVALDSYHARLPKLKALINSLFEYQPQGCDEIMGDECANVSNTLANGNGKIPHGDEMNGHDSNVKGILAKFVNFVLHHPKVLASPASLPRWLAHELQMFLLAHVTHIEDCNALSLSPPSTTRPVMWYKPRTTFFNWVRSTSADHTSCPYSFVFFLCLVRERNSLLEMAVPERYALEDACRHLAAMCRQYNDLGSGARDQDEGNLNSINFPEFFVERDHERVIMKESVDRKKRDLLAVAEYERRCLDHVFRELEQSLDRKIMEKLRLLIQVTDLYGQIYVVRDIGVRREECGPAKVGRL